MPDDEIYLPADRPPTRSQTEIWQILDVLRRHQIAVVTDLQEDEWKFQSRLRLLDLDGRRMLIDRSTDPNINTALLGRGRCSFHSSISDWHVEFVAARPREALFEAVAVIEFEFPELLVRVQQRTQPRSRLPERAGLECLADAAGIAPFDAVLIDAGPSGLGFLLYDPAITLEPGTRLLGCQITTRDGTTESMDLEVRYTQPIVLADGRRARRAGCRVVGPAITLREFVSRNSKR